ncbi:MAG: translation initiation factor IF-2 N-terminal domain-containing protein [Persephonella sp.]|nr:translation initiation factor IF-2 N-terminal domain-containing protein [Persephonella sp.]
MSKVKISELAKEFGMTWKQLAEEIQNLTGETIKSPSTKVDEEVVSLLRDVLGDSTVIVEDKAEEKKEEKRGVKLWDLAHEIDVSIDELKEGLKALGYEGEIDSFTVIDESVVERLKQYVSEREKREEEKKKKRRD